MAEIEVNCAEFARCSVTGLLDFRTRSSFSTSSRRIFQGFWKGASAAGSGEGGNQSSSYKAIINLAVFEPARKVHITRRVNPRYSRSSKHGSPKQTTHFLLFPRITLFSFISRAFMMYWRRFIMTSTGLGVAIPSRRSESSDIALVARALMASGSVSRDTHAGGNLGGRNRIVSFAEHSAEHSNRWTSIHSIKSIDHQVFLRG
jgi:hypothetical protein